MIDELLVASPCIVSRGEVPSPVDKNAGWRQQQDFERGEVGALLRDVRIPELRRVGYALSFRTRGVAGAHSEVSAQPVVHHVRIPKVALWARGKRRRRAA